MKIMNGEKGFALLDAIISVAIVGIVAVILLSSLGTSSKAVMVNDTLETAKNLAEAQMEYVKSVGYSISYDAAPVPAQYIDYVVTIGVAPLPDRDNNIQFVTVTVTRYGKNVFTLEGYKVN